MMTWFTEDATFPMVTGAILALILLGLAISSRERWVFYSALAVAALTTSVVLIEQLIVTDQEQVRERVYQLAFTVQQNDLEGVLEYVSPARPDLVSRVKAEMPGYDFDSCMMTGVSDFQRVGDAPPTVEITFNVSVRVRIGRQPESLFGQRRVWLKMEKDEGGQWQIIDYRHWDPRQGLTV